ncbi:MAG: Mur ligase family protein, partial [bacterium]
MTTQERIKERRIGIVGMARSGLAAALLAKKMGGVPFVSDNGRAELLKSQTEQLNKASIPFETDGHTDKLLECDYIIISPGIPLQSDIVKRINEAGLPIFSEIEFASWVCKGRIVAITGSNGKTTTTTLIGEIFKAAGFDTYVCGNIGLPFAEVVTEIPYDGIAVVEVSNFQLETISDFKPHIAMILNLSPDHLDRHGTFEAYKEAK